MVSRLEKKIGQSESLVIRVYDYRMRCLFILIVFLGITEGHKDSFHIGVILTDGDEVTEKIIDNVLWKFLSNGLQQINYLTIKEKVLKEEAFHYHAAVCRLLKQGVGVVLTPTTPSSLPILGGYSNEYNVSLISPSLLETPQDPKAEELMPKSAVGIEPSTTRAMLDLIRDLRWQEIVYIYDYDYGPEKLQKMFRIGYQALHLKVLGFAKVNTAMEAIHHLRNLDSPGKTFHVILDTDLKLTRDLLQLHIHHTGGRKKNYHFIISRPALEAFWMQHEFGALNITGFLALTPNLNRFNNVKGEWMKLLGHQSLTKGQNLSMIHYWYHDAAQFLSQAIRSVWHRNFNYRRVIKPLSESSHISDCLLRPIDNRMFQILKKVKVEEGLSGRIEFSQMQQSRINVNLTIVQSTPNGFQEISSWSDLKRIGGFRRTIHRDEYQTEALPQISSRSTTLRITTLISPPYMMLNKNGSFEGYCKDMIDIICEKLQKHCELHLVADGTYGTLDPQRGRWSGMIGEILDGTADIALGDLIITGARQRVVEFTDPFDMVSMSVVLKNPKAVGESMFFVFTAFTVDVWICIVVATILLCLLFHGITKFTGAPDSIESVSGIWGRKNDMTMNAWFTIGSSMMQGTGAFPRSISSRLLTVAWWSSSTLFTCMYIASLTAQLQLQQSAKENDPQFAQLKTLSLESILLESLERGWPKISVISPGHTENFIKRSNLPLYTQLSNYFESNPDQKTSDLSEALHRVRQSNGGHILVAASTLSDYAIRRAPCDLLAAHDSFGYAGYGIALSPQLHSTLARNLSDALTKLHDDGVLGQLHRNWWIESSECPKGYVHETSHGTLYSVSGAICLFWGLSSVVLVIFIIQFSRRVQDKESRRQQLTFDDMNLDHRLPTPPPELLSQPPPVLNVPEIENRNLSGTNGSESFTEFFERMRSSP